MKIVITGASGGIGRAFSAALARRVEVESIVATWHSNPPDTEAGQVTWQRLDLTDEGAVRDWAQQLGEIDWVINAAGMLHSPAQGPEKTIRQLDPDFFLDNIRINTLPTLLLAKYLHPGFRHGRPAVFATVSARVGSIEDNHLGGWFSYRASKAALNMSLKTLAIEWRRMLPNVAVVALHPGTTDTPLSRPFHRNVPREQLFTPAQSVSYLLNVLDGLRPAQTGRFLAFDGEQLPW
jgi:NAD(P)-dependent dehydrogenase (short-subunit alcohol dehydrogenase family)